MTVTRRQFLLGGLALIGAPQLARAASPGGAPDGGAAFRALYARYCQAYVKNGQVVDPENGGVTHTEGLGVTMLFAAHAEDKPTFEACWTFAQRLRRDDGLFSWKWLGGAIADHNNASDGDIYLAWALLVGAQRFRQPGYQAEALRLMTAIKAKLVCPTKHGLVLLPGATGFTRDAQPPIVNLSYWVFPALVAFNQVAPAPEWDGLIRSGLLLAEVAYFGKYQLPVDWMQLTDPVKPAAGWPPLFGYDAIRIPLYLRWAGYAAHPALKRFKGYSAVMGHSLPGSYQTMTDQAAPYKEQGFDGVVRLVQEQPVLAGAVKSYYGTSLTLLALLAQAAGL